MKVQPLKEKHHIQSSMHQWNFSGVGHGLLSSSDTFENITLHPNKVKEQPIFKVALLVMLVKATSHMLPPSMSNSITKKSGDGPNKTVCFSLRVEKNYTVYKFTMKPCYLLWTNSDIRVILIKKTMISLVNTVYKSSMQWKTKQTQSFIKELYIIKATWAFAISPPGWVGFWLLLLP